MANFYISDLHLFHKNIMEKDNRPFATLEEMHSAIISNWNERVEGGDTVYVLGDFSMGKKNETRQVLDALKGRKVLVVGNHDNWVKGDNWEKVIEVESSYLEIKEDRKRIILSHYPILFNRLHRRDEATGGGLHLYGHVHMTLEFYEVLHYISLMRKHPQLASKQRMYNVGANLPYMDYTPRTLKEIQAGGEQLNEYIIENKLWESETEKFLERRSNG